MGQESKKHVACSRKRKSRQEIKRKIKKKIKGSKCVFTAEHIDNIGNFNNDIDISLNNSLENLDDDVF
jgi:hypothetical protein